MIEKRFEEEYKKLNKAQKEAVDSIEGPVMVIAGPGTGKTTILTLRIANILKVTDTPPSGILALTFTEAGAKAMRMKLREIIGARALEVAVHTFHGFAMSVIREFEDHFPHLARSKEITEIEAENLVREILKDQKFAKLRPLGEPEYYIAKIISAISDCKKEAWTPEMVAEFAASEIERVKNDPESISSRGASKGNLKADALRRIEKCGKTLLFAEVYGLYEKIKKEKRKIDFDDMLFELLQTLRHDPLLLQSLQEKYLYLMIDEHQDTNDTQNLIIRMIADFFENPNLFVVGDEKQAIYRFQGASVQNFLGFQKIWSSMKIIPLEENYRSHQHILDGSFKMIEQNYTQDEHQNLRVRLLAKNGSSAKPIELLIASDQETEELGLVERLREIEKTESQSTVAVIARRNSDVEKIFATLENNELDVCAEKGANIFNHPLGELYFSLVEFLADPAKTDRLAETLIGGLWGIDFADQVRFISLARSGKTGEVVENIGAIKMLQQKISTSGVIDFLVLTADVSGFTKLASQTPLGSEVWRGIIALSEELAKAQEIASPKRLIEALLAYKKTAERRAVKINVGKSSAQIRVMTAHGSKGLEFDYVFLPYAFEESWIKKDRSPAFVLPKEKEVNDDIRDDRRLFYVALTRAKKHLLISRHEEDQSGKLLTPLRFIDELDEKLISNKTITPKIREGADKSLRGEKQKNDLEKIEYAKNVILEKGISVTALNHFIECPSKFFYKSILKLPEAPNPTSEKGNAMHEAMRRVWNLTPGPSPINRRGERDTDESSFGFPSPDQGEGGQRPGGVIEQTIKNTVTEYFKHSPLPLFEKETILNELLADAPKVARELELHFKQEGRVATESWVETFFTHQQTEFRIHGKLDVILEQDKKVLIYDYKTKKAMSVNAIKGETASEDGGYFRQLVFYKMLLENKENYKNKEIEPALVFIRPDEKGRCPTVSLPIEKSDIEEVEDHLKNLIDSVWSSSLLTSDCSDPDCKYCKYKKI